MGDIVSATIKPKGRIVTQFLQYFGPALFRDKAELFPTLVEILERDKKRLKGNQPYTKADLTAFLEECSAGMPDIRSALAVAPDLKRRGQPYRIVFSGIEGVVESVPFRLYGDLNPIETLRDNNVNIAVVSSDLLLAKFVNLLPQGIEIDNPAAVLANLPPDTTSVSYEGKLAINGARHMLIMNFRPESIPTDPQDLPLLEEGTLVVVNGEYYLIYKYLFNDHYRLREGEKVEQFVLQSDGSRRYGIEIVASGTTLLEEAARTGSALAVFRRPIAESSAILLSNEQRKEGNTDYRRVMGLIKEVNQGLPQLHNTSYDSMARNLDKHLVK
ncbi:hypothetical protein HYV81_01685 [Candidatus Woesearchaeota archaeon]|nr:hypothetical protein [Candidatus Woesearchaeota archaeon]